MTTGTILGVRPAAGTPDPALAPCYSRSLYTEETESERLSDSPKMPEMVHVGAGLEPMPVHPQASSSEPFCLLTPDGSLWALSAGIPGPARPGLVQARVSPTSARP